MKRSRRFLYIFLILLVVLVELRLRCTSAAVCQERLDYASGDAVRRCNALAVRSLRVQGFDPNAEVSALDKSLIHAVKRGHTSEIQTLLKQGANPNVRDAFGDTPLSCAVEKGYVPIVRLLLEKGADSNTRLSDARGTCILVYAASEGKDKIVKLLLAHKADVNDGVPPNGTALHAAAEADHLSTMKVLLAAGADIHTSNCGEGNLTGAVRGGNEKVARYLLSKGAHADEKNKGDYTPLMRAAGDGNLRLVILLVRHGAKVNYRSSYIEGTPLICAVAEGHTAIVKYLLAHGANASMKAEYQYDGVVTALTEAKRKHHTPIIKLLKQAEAR